MDSSKKQKQFYSIRCILIIIIELLPSLIEGSELPLSRDDLREKFGQGNF